MTEPTYRIEVARKPSTDFLEDAHGAILQAQVLAGAEELSGPVRPIEAVARIKEDGEIRLVLSAPDPAHLHDLSDTVMLRYGHELPDAEEAAPAAGQPPLLATQSSYSARAVYGTVGAMIVESTAKAILHEALERENLNEVNGLADRSREEVRAYRRLSERLGVTPPAEASANLQAGRALLSAIPEESFLGETIGGEGAEAVLVLLKEKRLITEDEAITAALSLG